jgi:hypothetical protein
LLAYYVVNNNASFQLHLLQLISDGQLSAVISNAIRVDWATEVSLSRQSKKVSEGVDFHYSIRPSMAQSGDFAHRENAMDAYQNYPR